MRSAWAPNLTLSPFTRIDVPDARGVTSTELDMPLRGQPGSGSATATQELARSRYGRIYRLARTVSAGAATNYDVVKRIGAYLEAHYAYSERPPRRRFPLDAFLFQDKAGYCQQFSGAAALMLRMLGVPTRVASGFTPGTRDAQTKEYVVRDLDAHSWIEVWFEGIGWVPFDPTPALAPAASQSAALAAASAARGSAGDLVPKRRDLNRILGGPEVARGGTAAAPVQGKGTAWAPAALAGAAVLLLAGAIVAVSRRRRRARRRPRPLACGDADVDHLIRLLGRLGLEVDPRTTLFALEQRLERLGGPEAAAYARNLRERRFGSNGHGAPGRAERRLLRRIMAEGLGAGPFTRMHLALPERPASGFRALKLGRLQRSR
jgi:hypothetical protein